jgi:isoamyl acetate esterase
MAQAATPFSLAPPDLFVLFGDSITQQCFTQNQTFAFGAALADAYARKLDVVNRGLSGYNTTQALRALSFCIPDPERANVRFLLIFFGANDARVPGSPGGPDQFVPLEEFKQNLRHMVTSPSVRAHPDMKIILVTTPPIDERKALLADEEKYGNMGRVLRRTASNTATYANAVRAIGAELNLPVLDIFSSMLVRSGYSIDSTPFPGSLDAPTNANLQSYLHDGLHFSGKGYSLLFGELMALIERTWPDQMPERLPVRLPPWDAADAWRKDVDGNPLPWRDDQGVVVTGKFEAVLKDVQRVS